MVMTKQHIRLGIILGVVVVLLLVPMIAMQFTSEVNWSYFDFVVAGTLLLGTGLACEMVLRKVKLAKYRVAICVAILAILILVWAELAVGIFGTPFAGN